MPSQMVATDRPPNAPQIPAEHELDSLAARELERSEVEFPLVGEKIEWLFEFAASMPAETWEVEWLADELTLAGPLAAFEWVRDHIRYEPYQGTLRGAEGTLAARAGNSVDQALLLDALLERQLVEAEFVFGRLDDGAVARLLQAARDGPARHADEFHPGAAYAVEGIAARARRDYAVLRAALQGTLDLDEGNDESIAAAAAREHTWLRIPFGSERLDLDPTLAEHQPGDQLTDLRSAAAEIPAALSHEVRVQVILEELAGDMPSERAVLDVRLDAVTAAAARLHLLFEPDLSGFAGAIAQVLAGDERWSPVLLIDGERVVGEPFSAGGSGVDLLGDESDLPEPVSARLVASTVQPDGTTREAAHELFDRRAPVRSDDPAIAPELRELRVINGAPDILLPVTTITVSNGGASPRRLAEEQALALDFVDQVLVDEVAARPYILADRLWPYAVAGRVLAMTSEQVLVPAAGGGGHGYVAEPRVYVHTIAIDPGDPDDWIEVTDLMLDAVRVLPAVGGAATAPAQLWYGTLQSALETDRGLRALAAVGLGATSRSASIALEPQAARAYRADEVPTSADPALLADAAGGSIIVSSVEPGEAEAWWAVDPVSGTTRAMLSSGYHGVRDVVAADTFEPRFSMHDSSGHRKAMGSKKRVTDRYGRGNTSRGTGYRPSNPPRKPGLPRGTKFRPPRPTTPTTPRSRCGGSEYITVISCVSVPATAPVIFLATVYGVAIELLTYKLLFD